MKAGLRGALEETRVQIVLNRDIIGLKYGRMQLPLGRVVWFVKLLKDKLKIQVCIHLCPSPKTVRRVEHEFRVGTSSHTKRSELHLLSS